MTGESADSQKMLLTVAIAWGTVVAKRLKTTWCSCDRRTFRRSKRSGPTKHSILTPPLKMKWTAGGTAPARITASVPAAGDGTWLLTVKRLDEMKGANQNGLSIQ
jgi:hypothetical protein